MNENPLELEHSHLAIRPRRRAGLFLRRLLMGRRDPLQPGQSKLTVPAKSAASPLNLQNVRIHQSFRFPAAIAGRHRVEEEGHHMTVREDGACAAVPLRNIADRPANPGLRGG